MLQRQFAVISHNLALILKDKYGLKDFCGFAQLRSSLRYVRAQDDLFYSEIILDEDIHHQYKDEKLDLTYLRQIEIEYGLPNLWPYIALDRIVMFNQLVREYPYNTPNYSHEEMLRIFQVKAKALIDFIDRQKPEYLIFTAIGSIGAFLLYNIAKKKGIKILLIGFPCLPGRGALISEDYKTFTGVDTLYQQNLLNEGKDNLFIQEAKKYLTTFQNRPSTYSAVHLAVRQKSLRYRQLKFILPHHAWQSLKYFIHLVRENFYSVDKADYTYIKPWFYFKDRFSRKLRNLRGAQDLYDKLLPDEDYVFYPLHYEPEIALLLVAPFFTDQINLIKQIARSLPVGFTLAVKEHPQMVDYRLRSYYQELKKIPNVKLISPEVVSFDLLKKAKLVTTITGTVGWEGVQLGRPVITFGHVFYNTLSGVKNCRTPEELPYLVKDQLENFNYNEKELIAFLAAIFEESVELDLLHAWENGVISKKSRYLLEPLADLIAKKLGIL